MITIYTVVFVLSFPINRTVQGVSSQKKKKQTKEEETNKQTNKQKTQE